MKQNIYLIGNFDVKNMKTLEQREATETKIVYSQIEQLNLIIHDLINENEIAYKSYQKVEILKQQEMKIKETIKKMICEKNQEILILKNKNREICENHYISGIHTLELLKKELLLVEKISQKEMLQIFRAMDLLFADFVTHLRERFELSESELLLAVFIKLGFTVKKLMLIYAREQNSIFKKKQRLKKKLYLDRKDDLETFLIFRFSFVH